MMRAARARRQLRALLAGDRCLTPASVFDPASARIADELGFECGLFGGSSASLAVLAAPDIALVTLTEVVEQVHRITRSCSVPIIVDADHGYGNALGVMRTVEELETIGVAGITIEDTLFPMPFGGYRDGKLVSKAEAVGKLRAALAARDDEGLVIMGRTIVPSVASTAELVDRVKAYADTGVDAMFLVLTQHRAQLEAVASAVSIPLVLGGYAAELADRSYLAGLGVRLVFQAHDPLVASIRAMYDTMRAARAVEAPVPPPPTGDLMQRIVRAASYEARTQAYLADDLPREKWR